MTRGKTLSLSIAIMIATAPFITTVEAAITLTVDAADEYRDATRAASGSLYGLTETVPANLEELVKPHNPKMFVNQPRSGQGYQQPYARAAAIPVAERLTAAGINATVTIRLCDLLPGWPYQYSGWEKWAAQVDSVIKDKLKSSAKNFYGYEIWNEWHDTWRGLYQGKNDKGEDVHEYGGTENEEMKRQYFYPFWKETFNLIRDKDPSAKIIGPGDAWYADGRMRAFLTYCKENNCVPDIICWHELGGTAGITHSVNTYRRLEQDLGISPRPISINEYGECHLAECTKYEGNPGKSAAIIAKIERLNIETACISWWHTSRPGHLGSLLASPTAKGPGWYFYKWYGDMSGKMITVTPPRTDDKRVDGFANIDHDKQFISLLFGGENDNSRTVNVTFNNLPAWMGETANVLIEGVDWKDLTTPSNGPYTILEEEREITNGSLSVSVTGCLDTSGYRIYLTPATPVTCDGDPPEINPNNLVRDGHFPNGSVGANSSWRMNNTGENIVASASVKCNKAAIAITSVGAETYQPQLIQDGITLENGKAYRFTFKASAVGNRTIQVQLERIPREGTDWDWGYTYGDKKTFDLTTVEQTFTLDLDMTDPTDDNVQLAFNFGGGSGPELTHDVTISDVLLLHTGTSSIKYEQTALGWRKSVVSVRGKTHNVSSPDNSDLRIRLIDVRGKVRANYSASGSGKISLAGIPAGRYFVEIKGANVRRITPVVLK